MYRQNGLRGRVACIAIALALSANAWAVKPGDTAPAWQGTDLASGDTITFPEHLDGDPAVVIFWATWCSYCKAFMPYVADIQREYADKGIKIITLNAKERGRGDPKAYAESLGFPMVAIAEADGIAEAYAVNFIPGLMIVDANARVVYRRRSTDLPAGKTVAQQWDGEVRAVLDKLARSAASAR